MAEHNNDQAGKLPSVPNPALKQFERLIGDWHISGPDVEGAIRFAWMEGDTMYYWFGEKGSYRCFG